MNNFIKKLPHQDKPPVSIEREENDVINIESVKYDGDYFRTLGAPETNVLYAVQRFEDGVMRLTLIRSVEEAKEFFEKVVEAL